MSEDTSSSTLSYKKSGVDVDAGDALVDWLTEEENRKPLPHADQIVSGIGGFASLFRASFSKYKKPCLVTCTDGVGTKVKLAAQFRRYEGIGQDLVAMCVNDLICTGGDPLLFLDYYATGKLDLADAKSFLKVCARHARNQIVPWSVVRLLRCLEFMHKMILIVQVLRSAWWMKIKHGVLVWCKMVIRF